MGEDFEIINKRTGEEYFLHICSGDDLRRIWLPACEELHLKILPHLGTLTWVSKDYEQALLHEMQIMNEWLRAHQEISPRHRLLSENWLVILRAIEAQPFDDLELTFL